jgi:hypothetical protein
MPVAITAAQAEVCAEAVDEPLPTPAGVGSSQTHHVSEPKLDDCGLVCGHYDGPSCGDVDAIFIAAAESIRA